MENLYRILTLTIALFMFSEAKAQLDPLMFEIDSQYLDCDSSFMILTNTTDSNQVYYYQWNVNGQVFNDPYFGSSVFYGIANNQTYQVTLSRYQDPNFQVFIDNTMQTYFIVNPCPNINSGSYTYQQVNGFNCGTGSSLVRFTASHSGGVGPYGYQWQHYTSGFFLSNHFVNGNPDFFENVQEGDSMYLTVYDDNLNTTSYGTVVTLSQTNIPTTITYSIINSDCNSTTIEFIGAASTPNASFLWNIQNGNDNFSETQQGFTMTFPSNSQFVVASLETLTAQGCNGYYVVTIPITVSQNTANYSYINTSTTPCQANQCSFEATLSSNGVAPFTYYLNAITQTSGVFTNLCEGFYTGSIVDANGCISNLNFQIVDSSSIYVQESNYFATCDSNSTVGSYMLIQTNPQNTVTWSDGYIGTYYQNPAAGTYNYIVTDPINGCSVSGTILVPSNNCYTISGNVYIDLDGDCVFNNNDYALSNVWVDLADSAGTWLWMYDFTDSNGNFSISAPAGTYYFDVNGYNTNGFTQTCPASGFTVTIGPGNPNPVVNFFLSPPAPVQDLSVSLYSFTSFTPGFPYWAFATYCNDGTIPMDGSVEMSYDAELTYIAGSSGTLSNHDSINHTLTWNFTNLMPGQCYSVYPDFVTDVSAVLGTTMSNTIVVNPIASDATPTNNTAYVIDTVVGSWDPNDKAVYPDGDITVNDKDHNYTIRFQNEGTAPAVLVVVRDDLDDNLDIQTLRNVSSSHNFVLTVENTDELVFTFNNIMLPAKQDDEPGSQGSINFAISQYDNLPLGTVIENTAAIYFDFNLPIITNTTVNTITEKTTGISNLELSNSILVYPNPSNGLFYIKSKDNLAINNIKVYDLLGQIVFEGNEVNSSEAMVSLQNVIDGIYLMKLETERGNVIEKITISNK